MAAYINVGYTKVPVREYFRKVQIFCMIMEDFFTWYNREVENNSWHRSIKHNEDSGGVSQSKHLRALAIDFNYPDEWDSWSQERKDEYYENVRNKLKELSQFYGQKYGLLKYKWGLHIDFCARTRNYEKFM